MLWGVLHTPFSGRARRPDAFRDGDKHMSTTLLKTRYTPTPGFTHPRWSRIRFVAADPADPATGDDKTSKDPAPDPDGDEKLGEGGKKALTTERDARKAAEQKVKDLEKQLEDSKKTDEQRIKDDLGTAQSELAASQSQLLRYEVAAEIGLDIKLASRLKGSTREEIEADAKAFKDLVGTKSTPKPDPHQGGGSKSTAKSVSAGRDLWAEQHPSKKTN